MIAMASLIFPDNIPQTEMYKQTLEAVMLDVAAKIALKYPNGMDRNAVELKFAEQCMRITTGYLYMIAVHIQ